MIRHVPADDVHLNNRSIMISDDGRSWKYLRSWLSALIYFLQLFRRINAISSGSAEKSDLVERSIHVLIFVPPEIKISMRDMARYGELLINWRILLLLSDKIYGNLIKWAIFPTISKLKLNITNYARCFKIIDLILSTYWY